MSVFHQLYHRISGGPTVLCPYCFEKFKLDDKVADQPVCPGTDCGKVIPINAVDYRNGLQPRLIGLAGAKNSGKTHFIASMLESIKRSSLELNWSLTGLGDAVERYRKEFYEPVFVDHRKLPLSNKGTGKRPLTFKLTIQAPDGKLDVIFLTFFDTAGETFASEELIERESKYICNSDGLILLLDPLQLPEVRRRLSGKIDLPTKELDTEDIVQWASNLIRRRRNVKAQDRIKTAVAVTFSKLDLLLDLCRPESPLRQPSKHDGRFSQSEFDDIDAEIRTHLQEWDASALVPHVSHNFYKSGFFGVSALGSNPDASGHIKEIAPMRILDPLIWHLSLHGIVNKQR